VNNIPRWPLDSRAQHCQRRLLALLRPNPPARLTDCMIQGSGGIVTFIKIMVDLQSVPVTCTHRLQQCPLNPRRVRLVELRAFLSECSPCTRNVYVRGWRNHAGRMNKKQSDVSRIAVKAQSGIKREGHTTPQVDGESCRAETSDRCRGCRERASEVCEFRR
jgi:hypothetical protein